MFGSSVSLSGFRRSFHLGLLVSGVWLLLISSASAAAPEPLWQVPEAGADSNGTTAGQLSAPRAVAGSSVDGHVFVAEGTPSLIDPQVANGRISEFTSWGKFVKAWGWGVRTGAPELETCTVETGCQRGIPGTGAGQLEEPRGVAIDLGGNVWVAEKSFRVQKFSRDGEFLLMIGREVNANTGEDICTSLSAADCGAGLSGTGPNQFSNGSIGDFIDVDSAGAIYVGDVGRIQQFDESGAFAGEIELQGELAGRAVESLAVDPSGDFYLIASGLSKVQKVDSSGTRIGELDTEEPKNVAVDVLGRVYVVERRGPSAFDPYVVSQYDPSGTCLICPGEQFATPEPIQNTGQTTALTGIATNIRGCGAPSPGNVYVAAFSNPGVGDVAHVTAYGPLPCFEPAPPEPPSVGSQFATSVGTTSAALRAEINPHFFAGTTYVLEYGTEDCELGGCTVVGPQPLGAERDAFASTRTINLSGLSQGTTYHYRFVATSDTFVTEGEDQTFTTRTSMAGILPDGRGYEMVSPPAKNNGEIGNGELTISPHQARPDGGEITYTALQAFGEDPKSASGGSQYISRRGPNGWVTENISPPDEEGYIAAPVRMFTEDLAKAGMAVLQPPLTPDAIPGVENLYLRNNANGAVSLITELPPIDTNGYCVNFSGASDDFSRIFFIAGPLTPNASLVEGNNLYEWSEEGGIQLVSVQQNGSAVPANPFNGFGAGGFACVLGTKVLHNAISNDGSVAYWTRFLGGETFQLLVRVNAAETIVVDKAQGGTGPAGNGDFWGASEDGTVAFFTAPGKLTPGVGANALYRFDLEAPANARLTPLTPGPGDANVAGVLAVSEDGSHVYFASSSVLAGDAKAGQPNLYLWQEEGGLRFIATLSGEDGYNWTDEPSLQTARTTPDGSALAFLSTRPLTGYDNTGQEDGEAVSEAFLYDAEANGGAGQLSCVSCNPTNARPVGGADLPSWSTPYQQPRYLSDSGDRLFFMSSDALDLHDTNKRQDVYEFERPGVGDCTSSMPTYSQAAGGCISLISGGSDASAGIFIDASRSGDDVFFVSPQRLVGQDIDENYDLYDARVGGGFAPPSPPPAPCNGENCRPPAVPPPPSSPGSSNYNGPGNVTTKKQKKKSCKGKKKGKKKSCKGKKKNQKHKSGRASK
jgi:hypothetical protein